MKRKIFYAFIAVAVVGFLGMAGVNAQVRGNSLIIQKLAERFNLNSDDVQKVFDEFQQERFQNMQQNMENRFNEKLDKMVSDGKLTEKQKEAISAKKDELQKKYEELKGLALTVDERNAKMKEISEGLKTWAEQNGIDLKFMNMFGCGFGMGHGGFMRGGFGKEFGPGHSLGPRW